MLVFAFIGIIPFIKNGKNKIAILTFFLLDYYIISSWDIWWYGGRAMVQSYPVLFFPVASLIEVFVRQRVLQYVLTPVFLLFIYLNIWLTYQEHHGAIYSQDNMTEAYFWRVVGRWSVPDDVIKLRDNDDLFEGQPSKLQLVYQNNFETDTSQCTFPPIEGNKSICLDKDHQNTADYSFQYLPGKAKWLRAQATFRSVNREWDLWKMRQFIVEFLDNDKVIKTGMARVDRYISDGETKDVYIDMKIPESNFNKISIHCWNAESDKALIIDNLKVWSFNE